MRALFHCSCLVVGLAACGTSAQPELVAAPPASTGPVTPGSGGTPAGEDAGVVGDAGAGGGPNEPGAASEAGAEAGGAPAIGCTGTPQWNPGDSKTMTLDLGDAGVRSYDVYVGTGVKPGAAVPLLVNMHGLTNSPALQAQFSQMNPVADANGFVVVYPAGIGASFNAGSCCGQAAQTGIDDVAFVRAIVADAESKICVDTKRVYETGFSNGGMMAYQLACNAADIFAAVAPTEGDNETSAPCTPPRPVPLAEFEYLGDPVVVPASAQQSVEAWAKQVECTDPSPAQTTEAAFSCMEWSQCKEGTLVRYCTLPGGTHYPPMGSAPVIWSFLSRFTLP